MFPLDIPLDIPPGPPVDSDSILPILIIALVIVVAVAAALTVYFRKRSRA